MHPELIDDLETDLEDVTLAEVEDALARETHEDEPEGED